MKLCGIIAEYNPFHSGHLRQLKHVKKELGADHCIVVMSGPFVQRGLPAILCAQDRARMALLSGADLVLELPAPNASGSAEFFARGGVSLLDGLGCVDTLCFGWEGFEDPFLFPEPVGLLQDFCRKLAGAEADPESRYKAILKRELSLGKSFPLARETAALSLLPPDWPEEKRRGFSAFLKKPNNILALEYLRALGWRKSRIRPVPVLRRGAAYHSTEVEPGKAPSASALRHLMETGGEKVLFDGTMINLIPQDALSVLIKSRKAGSYARPEDLDLPLYLRLSQENAGTIVRFADVSQELGNRILSLHEKVIGFEALADALKTKEITSGRARRALLHILLEIGSISPAVPYARVLGFRKESRALLKHIKANTAIPLITKLSAASGLLPAEGQGILRETIRSAHLYEACASRRAGRTFCHEYSRELVIV